MLGLVRKLIELRMKSDLKTLISVKMLALVLEKISLRMSLFVEGVMLKSLACHSIAGWCLLCLAVISFQIMNRICLSRFRFTDSITSCSMLNQQTNLKKPGPHFYCEWFFKVRSNLWLSPHIFNGQIGTDKHMLEASVK